MGESGNLFVVQTMCIPYFYHLLRMIELQVVLWNESLKVD